MKVLASLGGGGGDQSVIAQYKNTGMASMKTLAQYSKGFGGIMFWELAHDTTDSHSLYKVIQGVY